jgi:hypothetical protein
VTGAKGYVLELEHVNSWAWGVSEANLVAGSVTTYTFQNLVPNTQYWVYIYDYNASGGSYGFVAFTTPKE